VDLVAVQLSDFVTNRGLDRPLAARFKKLRRIEWLAAPYHHAPRIP